MFKLNLMLHLVLTPPKPDTVDADQTDDNDTEDESSQMEAEEVGPTINVPLDR